MKINHILLFFVLFLLVGCSGGEGGGTTTNGETELKKQLYSGTGGIEFNFLTDFNKGFENNVISSAFKVENTGPYNSQIVLVASVNPAQIEFTQGGSVIKKSFSLNGRTVENPYFQSNVIPFSLKIHPISEEEGEESTMLIRMCYDYEAYLSLPICVDKDPANIDQIKKPCETQNSQSTGGGQGGPVGISRIEHDTAIDENDNVRPIFRIYISNMGTGTIRTYGNTDSVCSGAFVESNHVNLIELAFSNFHLSDFDCSTTTLSFDEEGIGDDHITCTLKEGRLKKEVGIAYPTDLTVKIKYGYELSSAKNIKIEKI